MLKTLALRVFSTEVAASIAALVSIAAFILMCYRYRHKYLLPVSLRRLCRLRGQLKGAQHKELQGVLNIDIDTEAFRVISGLRCDMPHRELAIRLHAKDPLNANWAVFRDWLSLIDITGPKVSWKPKARSLYYFCATFFSLFTGAGIAFALILFAVLTVDPGSEAQIKVAAIIVLAGYIAAMIAFVHGIPSPFGYKQLDKMIGEIATTPDEVIVLDPPGGEATQRENSTNGAMLKPRSSGKRRKRNTGSDQRERAAIDGPPAKSTAVRTPANATQGTNSKR